MLVWIIGLWETVDMPNDISDLLIDAYQGSRPASAHCKKCGQTFRSVPMATKDAKSAIQSDFDAHKCQKLDVNQAAARIAKEATE